MQYVEIAVDALVLIALAVMAALTLTRFRSRVELLLGIAVGALALGAAAHLATRILFILTEESGRTAFGVGRFIIGAALIVFWMLMFDVWRGIFRRRVSWAMNVIVRFIAAAGIILLLFPQNHFTLRDYPADWAIIRSIPAVILAGLNTFLWFDRKHKLRAFRAVWIFMGLACLFTAGSAVGIAFDQRLYLLMAPAALAFLALAAIFLNAVVKPAEELK